MSLIRNTKHFSSRKPNAQKVILLCGYGGAIWQTRRLILVLNRAGYDVTALDFYKTVLNTGDPTLLPSLVSEVLTFAEGEAKRTDQKILLVGISLGALLSLNILRRSSLFETAIMITGGNIATVVHNIHGQDLWPQSLKELSERWKDVNIFSDPRLLVGKKALFVIPTKDKLIDTTEVLDEIDSQNKAGNDIKVVKRTSFGHTGTIVEETVLHPKRILGYIDQLKAAE